MTMRLVHWCLFTLSVGCLVPGNLAGQIPAQGPADSLALAFEREVFAYPEYDRRNPFKTLLTADGGGPRFENLMLLGILYSPYPGESIALFGEGTRSINPATPNQPASVTVDITGGTYRVRAGATLGNLTVRSIDRLGVVIELVEFGNTETRTLLLPRGTSGQGGP